MTSSAGGYLVPSSALPLGDDALDDMFQAMAVGITGLPGALVRPRWQPKPPKQPEPTIDWCAIGVHDTTPDDNAVVTHNPSAGGSDTLMRWEDVTVIASFFGPNAGSYADILRDGLAIPQNREPLTDASVAFVSVGDKRLAPDMVNGQWIRRYDLSIYFRRGIQRTYAVETIAIENIVIDNEHYLTTITTG